MKNILIVILLFCSSCLNSKKVGHNYQSGSDFLSFDLDAKKFYYVEKKPAGFYSYSEGVFTKEQQYIYLNSYSFDSCITHKIDYETELKEIKIYCDNYDPRFKILYEINGVVRESLSDGSLNINLDSVVFPLEVLIKIPFPNHYNYSCYKKFDYLASKILISDAKNKGLGIAVRYMVRYNYFNWSDKSDTIEIVNKTSLKSLHTNYSYKKIKDTFKTGNRDFLSGCLMIYLPLKKLPAIRNVPNK